ncbi:MAG: C40 family peptidase [Bacteroidales bacterium]
MRIRALSLLFVTAILLTSCDLLKIQPEPVQDDGIRITWEDTGKDHLVVSYKQTGSGREKPEGNETFTPVSLTTDTFSSDHAALFAEIQSWMGTPYGYGKHEKRVGTDCSGFTMEIYEKLYGIKLNRSSEGQVANTIEVKKEALQIGDLVFFNIRGNRISHVGMYIGNNKFVHATISKGVIISDMDEKYYKERYARSGRVIRPQTN